MTTLSHERQHELIDETLHEIRGDAKWLIEHVDTLESRVDSIESKVDMLDHKLDQILERLDS